MSSSTLTSRDWGRVVRSSVAPPPISGGTLLVTSDGRTAVAADPDRDRIWLVDLQSNALVGSIGTEAGDEPGRVVEGAPGTAYVALRRGGAVITIDVAQRTAVERRTTCPSPRGLAYDAANSTLRVACASGELVTLAARGGGVTNVVDLGSDLRDVVINNGRTYVSRFRAAELLEVGPDGVITHTYTPPSSPADFTGRGRAPQVAYRTLSMPGGGVAMLHQREQTTQVQGIPQGYYGSPPCVPGIVEVAVSRMDRTNVLAPPILGAVLATDVAFSPDGNSFAVVAPGNAGLDTANQLMVRATAPLSDPNSGALAMTGSCAPEMTMAAGGSFQFRGQLTSVAFANNNTVVLQSREPAELVVFRGTGSPVRFEGENTRTVISLPGESRADTGHMIFHGNTGRTIACASCHPEAGDDGHVWHFFEATPHRTQALRGGFRGSEPLHWQGDLANFEAVVHDTLETRMSSVQLSGDQRDTLATWLDRVPAIPVSTMRADPTAVERGRAVFHDPTVACASCHSGAQMTNNQTMDVGTGEALQVPTLRGLRYRAPYMHTGCAPTIAARFQPACGGGERHGRTAHLSTEQMSDLVAYLESL